jgi:hypothetical protein
MNLSAIQLTAQGAQKVAAFEAGRTAWRALDLNRDVLEFPRVNPYGDEYGNPIAKAFRSGFDAAARRDGYTYSRVTGEYCEGGEDETDEFPEPGDL